MANKILLLALAGSLIFSACSSVNKTNEASQILKPKDSEKIIQIPFIVAKRYFVRNDYPDKELHYLKITNQTDFDNIFGMATILGKDGKPTFIDFEKQYAIAFIGKTTDKATELEVKSVSDSDDTITIKLNQKVREQQTFTIRPLTIIIVDNQHQGKLKLDVE